MFPRGEGARLSSRNSLVAYSIPEARATTDETRHEGVGERGANSLAVTPLALSSLRRAADTEWPLLPALFSTIQRLSEAKLVIFYKIPSIKFETKATSWLKIGNKELWIVVVIAEYVSNK